MKNYVILLILIMSIFACDAQRSNGVTNTKSEMSEQYLSVDQAEQLLIEWYRVIQLAWFVNKQCKILPVVESAWFEVKIVELNAYAQNNELESTDILNSVKTDAELGSLMPKYVKCGEESEELVIGIKELLPMIVNTLKL